jgi:hypothetical protein
VTRYQLISQLATITQFYSINNTYQIKYNHSYLTSTPVERLGFLFVTTNLSIFMIMKRSALKQLIKEILNELYRSDGRGEWVEPDGKAHDIGNTTHWEWANRYVQNDRRLSQNPFVELMLRGWMRVVFSHGDSLIMITHSKGITKQQREYLEDQSEKTNWAVYDDIGGEEIYRPRNCITPHNPNLEEVTYKNNKSNIKESKSKPYIRRFGLKAFKKSYHTPLYLDPSSPKIENQVEVLFDLYKKKYYSASTYNLKVKIPTGSKGIIKDVMYKFNKAPPQKYRMITDPKTGKQVPRVTKSKDVNYLVYFENYGHFILQNNEFKVIRSFKEDFALGYSHGIVIDDPTFLVRDPLNDPELTGKLNEGDYRFDDFNWLGNMAGFRKPSDVYYGSILLGVIESESDGYVIKVVKGPLGDLSLKPSPQNKFKTKDEAAKILHNMWRRLRKADTD